MKATLPRCLSLALLHGPLSSLLPSRRLYGSFSSTINSSACFGRSLPLSLSQSASLLASLENVQNFPSLSLLLSLFFWFLKYCADQIWSNCYKQQKFHSQRVKRMLHPNRVKGEGGQAGQSGCLGQLSVVSVV